MIKLPLRITYEAPGNPSLVYQTWKAKCRAGKLSASTSFVRLWKSEPGAYTKDPSARIDVIRMLQEIGKHLRGSSVYAMDLEGAPELHELLIAALINHFSAETTVFPGNLIDENQAVEHVLFRFRNYWVSPAMELGALVMEQFLEVTEQIVRERHGIRDAQTPGIIRTDTRELQCYGKITHPNAPLEVVVRELLVGSA